MGESKQRHYCTCCGAKKYAQKLQQVYYPLLKQYAFHCNVCLSANADNVLVKKNSFEPYLIEIFSGSKTVSKKAGEMGFRTFTIDIEPEYKPDLVADILTLKASKIPRKGALLVWASVPCTWFSILNIVNHWKKNTYAYRKYQYLPKTAEAIRATHILEKTLHLIEAINPVYFVLENPRGAMRHMPQTKGVPYRYTVSYADYGLGVYKPTDLFTNIPFLKLHQLKGARGRQFTEKVANLKDAFTRSIVPPLLIEAILRQIANHHGLPLKQPW